MKMLAYPADIVKDEDGRYVVTFPDFGWGATDGATLEEALLEAEDCLSEMLATAIKDGLAIPEPTAPAEGQFVIHPTELMATKTMLNMAVREKRIKTVELARCLNVNEKEARRILDPYHKTKLPRMAQALRGVGMRMVISFEERDLDNKPRAVCS